MGSRGRQNGGFWCVDNKNAQSHCCCVVFFPPLFPSHLSTHACMHSQVRFSYDYGRCWRVVPLATAMFVENIRCVGTERRMSVCMHDCPLYSVLAVSQKKVCTQQTTVCPVVCSIYGICSLPGLGPNLKNPSLHSTVIAPTRCPCCCAAASSRTGSGPRCCYMAKHAASRRTQSVHMRTATPAQICRCIPHK